MQNKPRLTSLSLAVVATTLLLGSTSALAANYKDEYKDVPVCPACVELHDGFYVGAQVGYDSYRVRVNSTLTDPAIPATITANPVYSVNGWVGGLFAGYGMYFNNLYYLAAEIFGNGSGASQSETITATTALGTDTFNGKFSVSGSYGISLLPGIKLNNATLLYIRLGWNRANLKGQGTFTSTAGGGSVSGSNSSWQSGFNYGIGMESLVYQNFSLRAEYTHTNYGSFSSSATNAFGTQSVTFKPSDNQFMLGLIYHFM